MSKKNPFPFVDTLFVGGFLLVLALFFIFFPRRADYVTILLEVTKSYDIDQSYVPEKNMPVFWFAEHLKSTTLEKKDIFGQKEIEILRVIYPESGEESKTVFVEMRLRSVYDDRLKQYSYNGMPLLIGSAHRFTFENVLINGIVRRVSSEEAPSFFSVRVKAYLEPLYYPPFSISQTDRTFISTNDMGSFDGIPRYISEKIYNGMTMKDSDGVPIAELTNVIKNPGKKKIYTTTGQLISVYDSDLEHVTVEMTLQASSYDGNYYFLDRYPLLIGNTIFLYFDHVRMPVTITDIAR